MIGRAMQAWRRRYWRPDHAELARFGNLKPIKVVTGGSAGIGLALAREFARIGDHVLLVARTPETLDKARTEIAHHRSSDTVVATLALDVTANDAPHRLDTCLADLGGYCDLLVNAAGIGAAGRFVDADPTRLDQLTALNVAALSRLTRHVLPDMLVRGRGGILNVSSLGGYTPGPYQAAYYASKSYVTSLTEALAHECAGQGVRVAVLAPGPVRTAFHESMQGETGLYLKLLPVPTAARVARSAVLRFRLGQRVILPGLLTPALMIALRVLPHRLTNLIVATLLKPR